MHLSISLVFVVEYTAYIYISQSLSAFGRKKPRFSKEKKFKAMTTQS